MLLLLQTIFVGRNSFLRATKQHDNLNIGWFFVPVLSGIGTYLLSLSETEEHTDATMNDSERRRSEFLCVADLCAVPQASRRDCDIHSRRAFIMSLWCSSPSNFYEAISGEYGCGIRLCIFRCTVWESS